MNDISLRAHCAGYLFTHIAASQTPFSVIMYSAVSYGWSGEKATSNVRTPNELDAASLTVRSDFRNIIRVVTKFDQARPRQGTVQLGLFAEIAAVT